MGNNPSLMLQAEEIEEIEKETGCEFFKSVFFVRRFPMSVIFSFEKSDSASVQPFYELGQKRQRFFGVRKL